MEERDELDLDGPGMTCTSAATWQTLWERRHHCIALLATEQKVGSWRDKAKSPSDSSPPCSDESAARLPGDCGTRAGHIS
jgi:hypothetical protein